MRTMDNKILRSPDYAASNIALKTSNQSAVVTDVVKTRVAETSDALGAVKSIDDQKKEYAALLTEVNEKAGKLNQLETTLKQNQASLETEKLDFKEKIEAEVTARLDKKYAAEYAATSNNLLELIDGITNEKNAELIKLDNEIVEVVFESVCKILGKSVVEKDAVVSMVHEVIRHAQDRMHMIIRVAPLDFELIQDAKEKLCKGLNNRVDVVADEHVTYGGCIVETDAGAIDGRIEQQLSGLLELILHHRTKSHGVEK